jgi:hypothetical protein
MMDEEIGHYQKSFEIMFTNIIKFDGACSMHDRNDK